MLKTKAIVLLKRDYGDFDSLVSFYSLDFGKIDLLARGLKRSSSKLAGHLEPLNLVDLMIIKGRERNYVGSAINDKSFLNIKSDYWRLNIAGQALKLVSSLTYSQQTDFPIFLALQSFLDSINQENLSFDKVEASFVFFKFKLLYLLGYDLDLSHCFYCSSEDNLFFDYVNKEIVCQSCKSKNIFHRPEFLKVETSLARLKEEIVDKDFSDLLNLDLADQIRKNLSDLANSIEKSIK